jgi:protein TonB
MRASNSNALSRTASTIVVAILHVIAIYAISMSLGLVRVPKLLRPIDIIDVHEQKKPPPPDFKPSDPNIQTPMIDDRLTVPPLDVPIELPGDFVGQGIEITPPVIDIRRPEHVPPRALHATMRVEPNYPGVDRRLGHEGRVELRVHVDEQGRVLEVEVVRSSGFPGLDASAVHAVRRWRFSPATNGTETIGGWGAVAVTFRLEESQMR